MPEYLCRVGTPKGGIAVRSVTAGSASSARKRLAEEGFRVFDLEARSGGWADGAGILASLQRRLPALTRLLSVRGRRRGRISTEALLMLNRELAALVGAGLSLIRCLDILRTRRAGSEVGDMLDRVRQRVASGGGLAGAFRPEIDESGIPPLYVTNLEIGEASGELEAALRRYAGHLERARELKKRVRGALLYPAVLLTVSLGVVAILIGVVVPRFTDFYGNFEAELPWLTRILVGTTRGLGANLLPAAILAAAAVAATVWLVRSDRGRAWLSVWSLRAPLLGRLRKLYLDVETSRTLGTLLRGGTPLVPALEVTARGTRNPIYRRRILEVARRVGQGGSLHRSMEEEGLLDSMGLEMVHVGESTGSLEEMLEHVSSTYDEILEQRLDTAVGLLEPAVLVTMGLFVALILLSLYLPLFETVQVVG